VKPPQPVFDMAQRDRLVSSTTVIVIILYYRLHALPVAINLSLNLLQGVLVSMRLEERATAALAFQ
jgi:hypothetical protein